MKKLIAISLISILLLQFNEVLLIFKAQQLWIQEQMRQKLLDEDVDSQKMTLTLSEYQKSKINATELLVEGKMYDVKSLRIIDNLVELLVINDEEEKQKLNDMNEFVNSENGMGNDFPQQITSLLSLNYISPNLLNPLFIPFFSIIRFGYFSSTLIYSYSSIFDPPPKLV